MPNESSPYLTASQPKRRVLSIQGGMLLVDPLIGRRNLCNVYAQATPVEVDYGRRYWQNMRDTMASEVGEDNVRVFAGMFCALSPNNTEKNNWIDAREMYRHYCKFGTTTNIPYHVPIHTYKTCIKKCDEIWATGNDSGAIRDVLNGNKTTSMFMNITEPFLNWYVTIDGHMVSCYQGQRLTTDQAGINSSAYEAISGVFRGLAESVYMIPTNQLQAILWLVWRRINKTPGYQIKYLFQAQLKF
jgi:hypothetical protein